uniref:Endothelin-like toxin domain-containing protein n=1 Tax=Fundulus heteroclitus TaxID=8078 RepID=A0A3Q2PRJ0_FUNHE
QDVIIFNKNVPVAEEGPVAEEEGPLALLAHAAHRREKRCSCENQKDKECIFFCHIGIVWADGAPVACHVGETENVCRKVIRGDQKETIWSLYLKKNTKGDEIHHPLVEARRWQHHAVGRGSWSEMMGRDTLQKRN